MRFTPPLSAVKAKIKTELEQIVALSINELFSEVVRLSAVDTGAYRHNWQPSVGNPASGVLAGFSVPDVTNVAMSIKLGQTAYLTNNISYAQYLLNNPTDRWLDKECARFPDYVQKFAERVSGSNK